MHPGQSERCHPTDCQPAKVSLTKWLSWSKSGWWCCQPYFGWWYVVAISHLQNINGIWLWSGGIWWCKSVNQPSPIYGRIKPTVSLQLPGLSLRHCAFGAPWHDPPTDDLKEGSQRGYLYTGIYWRVGMQMISTHNPLSLLPKLPYINNKNRSPCLLMLLICFFFGGLSNRVKGLHARRPSGNLSVYLRTCCEYSMYTHLFGLIHLLIFGRLLVCREVP